MELVGERFPALSTACTLNVFELRWGDIDFGHGRVEVRRRIYQGTIEPPKSRASRRSVPLSASMAARLWAARSESRFRGDDGLVFPSELRDAPRLLEPVPARLEARSAAGGRSVGGIPFAPAHLRDDPVSQRAQREAGSALARSRVRRASRSRATSTCCPTTSPRPTSSNRRNNRVTRPGLHRSCLLREVPVCRAFVSGPGRIRTCDLGIKRRSSRFRHDSAGHANPPQAGRFRRQCWWCRFGRSRWGLFPLVPRAGSFVIQAVEHLTRRASGKRRSAQGSGRSVEHQMENLLDVVLPVRAAYLLSCPRTAPAGNTSL
jgi:hypothetical protein